MDRWMGGWMDEQMDGYGWMDGWMDGWIWMDRWMDGWVDGYGWMLEGWVDRQINSIILVPKCDHVSTQRVRISDTLTWHVLI